MDIIQIRKIKAFLISNNISEQTEGLKHLRFLIKSQQKQDSRIIEALIAADLTEILCELLSTLNSAFMINVLETVELILTSKNSFKYYHLMTLFNSVLRTLQISLKRSDETVLSKCLYILAIIISSLEHGNNLPHNDLATLIAIVRKIIMNNEKFYSIVSACEFLISFNQVHGRKTECTNLLEITLAEAVSYLCDDVTERSTLDLLSRIIISSLKFVCKKSRTSGGDACKCLVSVIVDAVKDKLIPLLLKSKLFSDDAYIILRTVLSVFYLPDNSSKYMFSVHLSKLGFLELIQSFQMICSKKEQLLLLRSVIYEILLSLCENVLGPDSNWKTFLRIGILRLPIQESFSSLNNKNLPEAFVIIVHTYFKLLHQRRPTLDELYSMDLCEFIVKLKEIPSERSLKAIWFIFAVAYLNNQKLRDVSRKSVKILINFLKQYSLEKIYTHHPVILYWSFTDVPLSENFRKSVMLKWIEGDNASQQELLECSLICKSACNMFLTLLATKTSIDSANRLLSLIETEFPRTESTLVRSFTEVAWVSLPKILASLCPVSKLKDSSCKICTEYVPNDVDGAIVFRVSCLLPGIIAKCYENSRKVMFNQGSSLGFQALTASFSLAAILIQQATACRDKRVLQSLLGDKNFLATLEDCYTNIDVKTVNLSLVNLLGFMLFFQLQCRAPCAGVVKLSTPLKVIAMLSEDAQAATACLRFLASFLEGFVNCSNTQMYIQIPPPSSVELKALYIRIHMICAQGNDDTCIWCWICLQHLLTLSNRLKLKFHLSTLPFTHRLLLSCSPESKSWSQMLVFLSVWLTLLPQTNRRAFSFSNSQKTVSKLANIFLSEIVKMKDLNDVRLKFILSRVLKIGAMPGELTTLLKAKMK